MFRWKKAREQQSLTLRAELVTNAIRAVVERDALASLPRDLADELLSVTQELAVVSPAGLATVVRRGERLLEQLAEARC